MVYGGKPDYMIDDIMEIPADEEPESIKTNLQEMGFNYEQRYEYNVYKNDRNSGSYFGCFSIYRGQ